MAHIPLVAKVPLKVNVTSKTAIQITPTAIFASYDEILYNENQPISDINPDLRNAFSLSCGEILVFEKPIWLWMNINTDQDSDHQDVPVLLPVLQ